MMSFWIGCALSSLLSTKSSLFFVTFLSTSCSICTGIAIASIPSPSWNFVIRLPAMF